VSFQAESNALQHQIDDLEKDISIQLRSSVFTKAKAKHKGATLIWILRSNRIGNLRSVEMTEHLAVRVPCTEQRSRGEAVGGEKSIFAVCGEEMGVS